MMVFERGIWESEGFLVEDLRMGVCESWFFSGGFRGSGYLKTEGEEGNQKLKIK